MTVRLYFWTEGPFQNFLGQGWRAVEVFFEEEENSFDLVMHIWTEIYTNVFSHIFFKLAIVPVNDKYVSLLDYYNTKVLTNITNIY